MAIFSPDELTEAGRQIDSLLRKLRKVIITLEAKENPDRYLSQITLAKRRVRAFEIAKSLIAEQTNQHEPMKGITIIWKCPVCGREFKNQNQQHFCGEKPKTIDEYIMNQEAEKRMDLRALHDILSAALPDAEERISWSMPTYWQGHNLVHFAASKNHIGFYVGAEAVTHFSNKLSNYSVNKGTIRIPYGAIDKDLIKEIAMWCLKQDVSLES